MPQGANKFNTRYATLGFNDLALLGDGEWTDAVEARVTALVTKAVQQ